MATMNINQTEPTPVQGDLDLSIAQSQTISGQVSTNQATALVGGQPVKLDSANTTLSFPQFVAAAQGDVAIGYVKRTVQANSFPTGSDIEVVGDFGPCMWLTAAGAITPGQLVEDATGDLTVQAFTSNKVRGIALDPASASGVLLRVIITDPVSAAS